MNELTNILNDFDFDDEDSLNESFSCFDVSHLDHYLTSEEYDAEEIICFSDVGTDHKKNEIFNEIENKFVNLYAELRGLSNGVVDIVLDGEVDANKNYEEAVKLTLREKPLYNFYFRSLGLYIISGYDLTHRFCVGRNNHDYLIKDVVNKCGLFILN